MMNVNRAGGYSCEEIHFFVGVLLFVTPRVFFRVFLSTILVVRLTDSGRKLPCFYHSCENTTCLLIICGLLGYPYGIEKANAFNMFLILLCSLLISIR